MKKLLLVLSAVLITLLALAQVMPGQTAQAGSSLPQVTFRTPTPNPEGKVLYKVQAGETCISISLLTGISVEELRRLNNLAPECALTAGQDLLLAQLEPAALTPTPGPSPTPTSILPTPTAFHGTGQVCVILFDDINGDALRQETEAVIPEGAVSLTDREGGVSLTGVTLAQPNPDEDDPLCFTDVPEGEYNVSVGVPAGYNPTTVMNYALELRAGDESILPFGAQLSSAAATPSPSEGGRNPTLGVLGGLLLIAGASLGVYMWRKGK